MEAEPAALGALRCPSRRGSRLLCSQEGTVADRPLPRRCFTPWCAHASSCLRTLSCCLGAALPLHTHHRPDHARCKQGRRGAESLERAGVRVPSRLGERLGGLTKGGSAVTFYPTSSKGAKPPSRLALPQLMFVERVMCARGPRCSCWQLLARRGAPAGSADIQRDSFTANVTGRPLALPLMRIAWHWPCLLQLFLDVLGMRAA